MSNPTTTCAQCLLHVFSRQQYGQQRNGCAYIHYSKSPKISFPILTWSSASHFPLLWISSLGSILKRKFVTAQALFSIWIEKVAVVFYILSRAQQIMKWHQWSIHVLIGAVYRVESLAELPALTRSWSRGPLSVLRFPWIHEVRLTWSRNNPHLVPSIFLRLPFRCLCLYLTLTCLIWGVFFVFFHRFACFVFDLVSIVAAAILPINNKQQGAHFQS